MKFTVSGVFTDRIDEDFEAETPEVAAQKFHEAFPTFEVTYSGGHKCIGYCFFCDKPVLEDRPGAKGPYGRAVCIDCMESGENETKG